MTPWLVAALVTLAGSAFTWMGVRWGKKGDRENALIDQLQEDLTAVRARLDAQEGELQSLRLAVVKMQSREEQWAWHAELVEGQVAELGGTPYPRPLALRRQEEPAGD